MLTDKQRNTGFDMALAFELAASFVAQFSTIDEAVAALELAAHKLMCKATGRDIPMPGEREHASWISDAQEETHAR
jgi:hypothetical protein